MATAKPDISSTELETLVLDVIAREARPVTVGDIHKSIPKALRPASKALSAIVTRLAGAKQLFRVGRRYSAQPDRSLHPGLVYDMGLQDYVNSCARPTSPSPCSWGTGPTLRAVRRRKSSCRT